MTVNQLIPKVNSLTMKITVSCQLKPTESREKVKLSLLNLFPELKIEVKEKEICGETESIEYFKELLKKQKIRDSARAILFKSRTDKAIKFELNKQVAYVGKINFVEEAHPLGNISVTIEDENIESIIDEIAPSTAGKGESIEDCNF